MTAQQDSIRGALGQAWNAQLTDLERHLPGAQAGENSEELHRFRVALRKTRALLKLFHRTLPQAVHFQRDFKWLAGATGEVRDLDVLSERAQLSAKTLGVTAAHITPIIEELRAERIDAQKKLAAVLRGSRARDLLESWRQFLARLPTRVDTSPAAAVPAWSAIHPLVIKQSRRMLQEGVAVGAATDPHDLHELRIRGKRLRYLLESFDEPVAEQGMGPLAKKLRTLQTVLGHHQDAVIAAARWQQLAATLGQRGNVAPETLTLLEDWQAAANAQQQETRARFTKALKKFARACTCL